MMSDSVYAVVAYAARYWFALLAVIILWRGIVWMRRDAEHVSREIRQLPDAGYIGEWVVIASDAPDVPEETAFRATRDGWIGSARACDIRLQDAAVPARAARFFLQGDGLHVQPERNSKVLVDGEAVRHEAVLRHGATLTVGKVTLQLRLFAGVLLTGETPVLPQFDDTGRMRTMALEGWAEEDMEDAPSDGVEEAFPSNDLEELMPEEDETDIEDADPQTPDGITLPRPAIRVKGRQIRRK